MKITKKNIVIGTVVGSLLILVCLVYISIDYFRVPEIEESSKKVIVMIPRGASISAIADTLLAKTLIGDKDLFLLWITALEKDRSLKAGYYEIPVGLNYPQLIRYLSEARAKEIKVTLVEGWTIHDIAKELSRNLNVNEDKLIELTQDSVFIKSLGIKAGSLEGYLLPDTYFFYWGIDEKQILEVLVRQCLAIFDQTIMARLDSMKMTRHQVLTLASIIEGEAIFDDERKLISSVYHNRLKRRIKLQADPTIQYILDGPPKRLLYKDLEIDSPYNTYKYYGLPPGPIKNPGEKSILAAIYPAKTDYLYFVATGDGRHTFTKSAAEHSRAKAKFDKIRQEVYREKKYAN